MLAASLSTARMMSKIGIYLSIVYLSIGIVLAMSGYTALLHPVLTSFGAMTVFVSGVAIAYIISIRPRKPLYPVLLVFGATLLYVAALIWLHSPVYGLATLAVGFAALGLGTLGTSMMAKSGTTVRASLLALGYTFLFTSAYLMIATTSLQLSLHPTLLGYIMAFPMQVIYAVTLHALPSTYNIRPSRIIYAAFPLASLSSLLLPLLPLYGALAASASLLIFTFSSGFTRIPSILRKLPANRAAGRAHRYFLIGHLYALTSIVLATILLISYGIGIAPQLYLIHFLLIGVVSTFIVIHAPLMLPVILGTRTARRYNQAPFASLLASAVTWILNRDISLVLFLVALVSTLLIVKPTRPLPTILKSPTRQSMSGKHPP
ncbi:hypothetical protein Pyrfu_0161 [Pyrolobus fumarii 1A]|uniref:Uncharacterized protein n=1 Tax=Pyrolobus fumarii (strain DSM 11204 / 1A) TaxID=694429 RepID=G0EEJ2_PYRF1|nr:hypothetical protein [Pyrolobus fumarii]AEM38033.1 hypothetical protein Pyrfu_0161 [Pyrolobus fumarii 1A]